MKLLLLLAATLGLASAEKHCEGSCRTADTRPQATAHIDAHEHVWAQMKETGHLPHRGSHSVVNEPTPCVNGLAGEYDCNRIDMHGFVHLLDMGVDPNNAGRFGGASDVWGWTDPVTKQEIAIIGMFNSTGFVDVTVPTEPVVLAVLPQMSTPEMGSDWRDIKTFQNYAYIVSDRNASDFNTNCVVVVCVFVGELRLLKALCLNMRFGPTNDAPRSPYIHRKGMVCKSSTLRGSDRCELRPSLMGFGCSSRMHTTASMAALTTLS